MKLSETVQGDFKIQICIQIYIFDAAVMQRRTKTTEAFAISNSCYSGEINCFMMRKQFNDIVGITELNNSRAFPRAHVEPSLRVLSRGDPG